MMRSLMLAARRAVARNPRLRSRLLRLAGPAFPALRRAFSRAEGASYDAWFARWQSSSADDDAAIAAAAAEAPAPFLVVVPGAPAGAHTRASLAAQVGVAARLAVPEEAAAAISGLAAEGGYVMRLESGEALSRHALAVLTAALRQSPGRPLVLYADEDVAGPDGRHRDPWFKAAFDPDRLLQQDSLGRAVLYDAGLLVRHGLTSLRDHALALAATGAACAEAGPDAIRHVPAVLLHRPRDGRPAPWRAGTDLAAVQHALARASVGGALEETAARPLRIRWPMPDPAPLVSVIVPTRDRADLMRTCLEGLLCRTAYPALEVIVIDNDSTEPALHALFEEWSGDARLRVLPMPGPFNFAALNNRAVAEARGTVLVLLNNDTEVRHADWLAELVSQVLRPGIGAVGARLLYPDGRVQHAGVGLGIGGIAAHDHLFLPGTADGPQDALRLVRTVSAVTAACLAVRRDAYLAAGGMDEARFAIAYNDIDLCLKLRRAGLRNLVTPHAELLHHESATRGSDLAPERRPRWEAECAAMRSLWGAELDDDPYLSPMLSRADAYGRLAEPPLRPLPWTGHLERKTGDADN